MKYLTKFFAILGIAALTSSLHAAVIVDQNQATSTVNMANFSQHDLAQSFQSPQSNIAGAGIFLTGTYAATDSVTISLWSALPNQIGANLLASGTGTATSGSWFDVFWNPAAITAHQTYYLVFTSVSNALSIAGDITNPYAGGHVFANSGFGAWTTFDYTFRTYFENQPNQVPEPGMIGLLGLGAAALFVSRRRVKH